MRGNIWTVVFLGVGVAMMPAILDVEVGGEDQIGEAVHTLVGLLSTPIALMVTVAAFGLLIVLFSSDGF